MLSLQNILTISSVIMPTYGFPVEITKEKLTCKLMSVHLGTETNPTLQ